jgi:hypothetical protein
MLANLSLANQQRLILEYKSLAKKRLEQYLRIVGLGFEAQPNNLAALSTN